LLDRLGLQGAATQLAPVRSSLLQQRIGDLVDRRVEVEGGACRQPQRDAPGPGLCLDVVDRVAGPRP